MSEKFHLCSSEEKKELTEELGSLLPFGYRDLSFCKVLSTKLPFYPTWTFMQIHKNDDVTVQPVSLFYKEKEVITLDWQAQTILTFNQTVPLSLSIHDIAGYVVFYFSHIRTSDGVMKIITAYDDFQWREEPSSSVKKTLSSLLRVPYLISWDEHNHAYEMGAHILFGTELYDCRLHVNKGGDIRIIDRVLLVEDMPVLDSLIGI